jgi:hypothetical protein
MNGAFLFVRPTLDWAEMVQLGRSQNAPRKSAI